MKLQWPRKTCCLPRYLQIIPELPTAGPIKYILFVLFNYFSFVLSILDNKAHDIIVADCTPYNLDTTLTFFSLHIYESTAIRFHK